MSHLLSQSEFTYIFSRVPRLTVEVVITSHKKGVVLALRTGQPNKGGWNLPGGTVRIGEHLVDAVKRVASEEIAVDVEVSELLGYIEYPERFRTLDDWPVGLAFAATALKQPREPVNCQWFTALPRDMYIEQQRFLTARFPFLRQQ